MIRIGILGNIGSGKSFISKLFNSPVFNADKEVNYIYKNNKKCFIKLKKKLPKYIKSFPIKKSELIKAVSTNQKNIKIISSIVHPVVRKRMIEFLYKKRKSEIVVLDIPLLIENKLNKKGDVLIFVKANNSKILKRLRKRKNYNNKILQTLKQNQTELSKKRKLANFIIDNNFSANIMKRKVKILNERSYPRY